MKIQVHPLVNRFDEPSAINCEAAAYFYRFGDRMSRFYETIRDLMLAGF